MASYGTIHDDPPEVMAPSLLKEVKARTKDDLDHEPASGIEVVAPYVAEFLGVFFIGFTYCISNICGDPMWTPTGIAFALTVLVYSLMPVSGAHLNPAVTLTLCLSFKFSWAKSIGYILAQVAGGIAGCLISALIFVGDHKAHVKLGPQKGEALSKDFSWYDIGFMELLYTFTICFVFVNCVASLRNNRAHDQNHFYGLAVGFAYIAGGYPALGISGSIFNPALTLAIGVQTQQFDWLGLYLAVQVGGAALAYIAFWLVRPEEVRTVEGLVHWTRQVDNRGHERDISKEDFHVHTGSKLISELIGTFVTVITVTLNLVMVTPAGPWSFAACYTCFVYALGDVSGGHFNPAVTWSLWLSGRGKLSIPLMQSYIYAQTLGAAGAGLIYAHYEIETEKTERWPLQPVGDFGWAAAGIGETMFSAFLCWVFLSVTTMKLAPSISQTNFYFGLAVGACITIGGFSIGNLAGWNMNPAVCVGRGVGQIVFDLHGALERGERNAAWHKLLHVAYYAAFETAGGTIAAMLFFVTHQREYLSDESGFRYIP